MWDSTPWFVKGGIHQPEVARLLAYAAVGGKGGVINSDDCVVKPLKVPGKGFRVSPGGVAVANGSVKGQMYVGRNPEDEEVMVSDTSSSGARTDLIIVRVEDPQYPGTPEPPDRATAQYIFTRVIEDVPVGTKHVREIAGHENDSAETLARITRPASTGTLLGTHITDLRRISAPRSERIRRVYELPNDGSENHKLASSSGYEWPRDARFLIDVPEWATEAIITCDWNGVFFGSGGNTTGLVWVEYGPSTGTSTWKYSTNGTRYDSPGGVAGYIRQGLANADASRHIPADIRGKTIRFVPKAKIYSTGADTIMDETTSVVIDVEFFEVPVGASD